MGPSLSNDSDRPALLTPIMARSKLEMMTRAIFEVKLGHFGGPNG